MTFRSLVPSFTTPALAANLAFYRDILGFTCTATLGDPDAPDWVELTRGEVRIMLLAAEAKDLQKVFFQGTGVIFYFTVSDLERVHADLIAAGHEVTEIEVTFYGMRECYATDPDGRQLTFAEPSREGDVVTITEL